MGVLDKIRKTKPENISGETAVFNVDEDVLTFTISGRIEAMTCGDLWLDVMNAYTKHRRDRVVVDASGMTYCDMSGISLLMYLRHQQIEAGGVLEVRGLSDQYRRMFETLHDVDPEHFNIVIPKRKNHIVEIGEITMHILHDTKVLIGFIGELATELVMVVRHPHHVRWRDVWLIAEKAGVNGLPLVALIGFLIGLIMSFQSAIPMKRFGAEIFVANLIGLSMLRELGPLMTAIVLAGRSGSAFAAEIGTMRVNEEIDALNTMGLDSIKFLVVPRVVAAVLMMPLLTIFSNVMGLIGGAVVFLSMGYPIVAYVNQVRSAVTAVDLVSGLTKAFAFGVLIAAVGCLRGLQTKTGASAVGDSATRAVVSGIILIALADGMFAVLFYYLKI